MTRLGRWRMRFDDTWHGSLDTAAQQKVRVKIWPGISKKSAASSQTHLPGIYAPSGGKKDVPPVPGLDSMKSRSPRPRWQHGTMIRECRVPEDHLAKEAVEAQFREQEEARLREEQLEAEMKLQQAEEQEAADSKEETMLPALTPAREPRATTKERGSPRRMRAARPSPGREAKRIDVPVKPEEKVEEQKLPPEQVRSLFVNQEFEVLKKMGDSVFDVIDLDQLEELLALKGVLPYYGECRHARIIRAIDHHAKRRRSQQKAGKAKERRPSKEV
eukprot:TRINITY_DN26632_c0_g1_i1.p1 TRINITY_DN26632_c0_g1~~TRINITY_DN26632_c0_g1_i1.p1  ORF type:complete len:291 (+),score=56.72 TRINITY_DN26632_c0_g1_i1:52-873(+)